MTKALAEADGASWREKLPPIPTVPLAVRQRLGQQGSGGGAEANGARAADKPGETAEASPEKLLWAGGGAEAVRQVFRCA